MHPSVKSLRLKSIKAQIPIVMLANIFKVNRSTVYYWFYGNKPSVEKLEQIERIHFILSYAINQKLLPTTKEKRLDHFHKAFLQSKISL